MGKQIYKFWETNLVRIKVWIKNNDGVGTPEIDANSTSSRGEKVYECIGVRLVELVHAFLAIRLLRVAILYSGSVRWTRHARDIVFTKRKYLMPSPSKKSSMTSKAITN